MTIYAQFRSLSFTFFPNTKFLTAFSVLNFRYSREESFSVLSVEIRNHPTLLDSLEQYVKGELLEGGDAYHCDKCDKKVQFLRICNNSF